MKDLLYLKDEQIKEFYLAINSVNIESDEISKFYLFMYLEIIAFIIVILLFSRSIYFFIWKKINVIVLKSPKMQKKDTELRLM